MSVETQIGQGDSPATGLESRQIYRDGVTPGLVSPSQILESKLHRIDQRIDWLAEQVEEVVRRRGNAFMEISRGRPGAKLQ